jgi:hypothetical protein
MYASEPGLGRRRPEVVALKRARGGWEQEAQKQQLLFFIARLVSTVDHDTDQSPWRGMADRCVQGVAPADASSLPDRLVAVEPRGRRHAPRVLHGAVRDVVLST